MAIPIPQHPAIPVIDLEFVGSLSAPFFWVLRDSEGEIHFKNGTVSFIDTGARVFAITACHVIDDCIADAKTAEFVQCMIGGNGKTLYFKLEDRLIDRNPEIDLATLKISEAEVTNIGCAVLRGFQLSWPPPLVQPDYSAVFCGYPGKSRSLMTKKDIMFRRVALGTDVSSSRIAQISLLIEREKMYQCLGDGELPENYNFGGISGGPLVSLVERGGIRGWVAAGIIRFGPNPGDDPSQDFISGLEIFYAVPIHFVKKDGYLDIGRWRDANP
jgi:hypothetical protein